MNERPDATDSDKHSQGFVQAIFEPLIRVIGKLPAPLAYGGTVIIALLTVVVARGLIQNNILWAVLSIFVVAIGGYIFLEVNSRKKRRAPAPRKNAEKTGGGNKKIKFEQIRPSKKKTFEFVDYVTIGRNPECSLSFPENEPQVSWEHGIVRFFKGGYVYDHLSDKHPTFIVSSEGGSRLARPGKKESIALKNQDRLRFGDNEYIVTFDIAGTKIPVYVSTTE